MSLSIDQEKKLGDLGKKIGCSLFVEEPSIEGKPYKITGDGELSGSSFYIKDVDSEQDFQDLLELIYDTAESLYEWDDDGE